MSFKKDYLFFRFEFLSFGIRICFEFRDSDFEFNFYKKKQRYKLKEPKSDVAVIEILKYTGFFPFSKKVPENAGAIKGGRHGVTY